MSEKTPGRAAYEAVFPDRSAFGWDDLPPATHALWESAANAAVAAYIEANGRDPVDLRALVAEILDAHHTVVSDEQVAIWRERWNRALT